MQSLDTKNQDEQYLRIFECRILRKIFGPVKNEDGFWSIRMNHELKDLLKNADIVRFVKSKRMACVCARANFVYLNIVCNCYFI
jgi:hypothetical protein